ncbi:hypothetical protein B0J11DRAFT_90508 [Dendryphion nanum]|uniref:Tetratricopeptide repeat protein 36 n=1 Tax=Dendryphion nanum TaxID=256645 RepID=A0A9P9IF78_9PLEO|nr:hypothetical protein B0J11DRAFT_90508 [Dendryphion nanum]
MAVQLPDTKLSNNDVRILNALFDPETLPSSVARSKDASIINASLPPHPTISSSQITTLETQQEELVKKLSTSRDDANFVSMMAELNEIIELWPTYPSVFLNRAMVRRLGLERDHEALFEATDSDIESLFSDLSRAIHLALPASSSSSPVSPYQARILRTAFSHRAFLYLKASEDGKDLEGKGKTELEELASKDFAAAARYGDEAAREMSVRTNPYAKMCGAIVKNALREERREAGE